MKRITKGSVDYAGVLWVLKARSTEESRYHLNYITAKDGELIATDGRRLHIYKPEMIIENGTYEVITSNKNEIILETVEGIEYPDWQNVFLKRKPVKEVNIDCYYKTLSESYTSLVRNLPEANTVNIEYFKDVLSISDTIIFKIFKEAEPIEFVSGKYRGLIMPIGM